MVATRPKRLSAPIKFEDEDAAQEEENELGDETPDEDGGPEMQRLNKRVKREVKDESPENSPPVKLKHQESEGGGINEYEQQRLANIERNKQLLRDLQIGQAAAGLRVGSKAQSTPRSALSKSSRRSTPRVKIVEDVGPRRTSSRLAGIQADSETARVKAETEYEAMAQAERLKRKRKSGDLQLDEVKIAGRSWNKSGNFLNTFKDSTSYQRSFTDQDVEETDDHDLKSIRKTMNGLRLYERFSPVQIKITPERIYSMTLHPNPEKAIVFAGDKLGNLGVFDASQPGPTVAAADNVDDEVEPDEPEPVISAFKLHSRTISSFQFDPTDSNKLYTSSYDSSIRKLDLTTSKCVEIWAAGEDEDAPVTAVEIPASAPTVLHFATLQGAFGTHDERDPNSTCIYQLHDKKIGGFSIHPVHPHLVATASLDRTLKIWDLRKITGKGVDKHPALLGEHESRLSVSCANWNSRGQVATSSYDDTLKVYNFNGVGDWKAGHDIGDEEMKPAHVISHNNQTGRWVTM